MKWKERKWNEMNAENVLGAHSYRMECQVPFTNKDLIFFKQPFSCINTPDSFLLQSIWFDKEKKKTISNVIIKL